MSGREAELLRRSAPLHDVAKIGVPDSILHKPGRHTPEEWEIMKSHALIGHDLLSGSDQEILRIGAMIALEHQERWDGGGVRDHPVPHLTPHTARVTPPSTRMFWPVM